MKLIAGATGVLGSGFVDVLRRRGEPYVAMQVPWGDPSGAAERVVSYWRAAEEASRESPITLVWAAGTGTVGASDAAMAAETATLAAVVAALARAVRPNPGNRLLFTSSAGALYGGHGAGVIDESTPPAPITPYGREKLAQEALVAQLSEAGVMGTVVCRFTNVYGLADGRLRRKGLVPALVESAMLREPVRLFVSPDTRRDYLFNVDAARLALVESEHQNRPLGADRPAPLPTLALAGLRTDVRDGPTGAMVAGTSAHRTAIVRSGATITVLDLVGSVSRVLRRRVPVVITESPESRVQPLVLRFRERIGIQATIPTTSFEAAIRSMAEAPRG
jgi:UDP-glucose 4-epimerase